MGKWICLRFLDARRMRHWTILQSGRRRLCIGFRPRCSKSTGSAPLPDPLKVYTAVENYLLAAGSPWIPAHFLNGADRMDRFLEFTASAGYLLATVPLAIRNLIVRELEAQSFRPTIL